MLRIRGLWVLPPERARAFLLAQREWYESRLATFAMEEAAFVLEGDAVDDPNSFVFAEYATLRSGLMHVPVTIAWLDWLLDRLEKVQPQAGDAVDEADHAQHPH
jgi:hypothetical protein